MFGSVVNLQPFGDAPRFGRFKFLVQRGRVVGVQVVPHQHNTVLVRVVLVHQLLDHSGPIGFGGRSVTSTRRHPSNGANSMNRLLTPLRSYS